MNKEKISTKARKMLPAPLYGFAKNIYLYFRYLKKYFLFKKLSGKNSRFKIPWGKRNPQLFDDTEKTGFDRHYTYHPAWAARVVKKINPKFHVDISSILQFSTILSAFVPVKFYDYRPADVELDGIESRKADLLALPFPDNSVDSLSCMHTIEHVGLGRYGDPLDPDGDIKAIKELERVLAPGGSLLVVVPIGKNVIQYNAHRIYSYELFRKYFSDLELKEFSLIPEKEGGIIKNATKEQADGESYGCGCFWFIKK